MRDRFIPIMIVAGVVVLGFVVILRRIKDLMKRREFTMSFQNHFIDMANGYFQNGRLDNDNYSICVHDVDAIQEELGYDGILSDGIDHLSGVRVHNYQLFMNIIPEMRMCTGMLYNSITKERIFYLVGLCDDALQRHAGNIDRKLENERKKMVNPFSCFGEGIRFVIGLPVFILMWCGVIKPNNVKKIQGSRVSNVISSFINIIGLVASVMTIIIGWEDTKVYLAQVIGFFR